MTRKTLTGNQQIVMAALEAAGKPLGAYQILDDANVRENGLKAPLTIYRALDKLVELGLVHRVESLNAFVVCDHDDHHSDDADPAAFMICSDCKRTIEFTVGSLKRTIAKHAAEHDFAMDGMRIEVSGHCEKCTAAR